MLERIAPFRTGALIATFRCAAPARCGLADELRIVAGDGGGHGADAKRSSSPLAQCGFADCHKTEGSSHDLFGIATRTACRATSF